MKIKQPHELTQHILELIEQEALRLSVGTDKPDNTLVVMDSNAVKSKTRKTIKVLGVRCNQFLTEIRYCKKADKINYLSIHTRQYLPITVDCAFGREVMQTLKLSRL